MNIIHKADKMLNIRSDIRGPIFAEAERMRAQGIDVLRLNTGNLAPFGFTAPESVRKALTENLDTTVGYCDSRGLLSARRAIVDYHTKRGAVNVDINRVFIGNGVSELVNMAMTALLNPGDEVLIPAPDYPLWTNCVRLGGGTPVHYICDEQADWYPDLDDIRSKINAKTRAIVIINPNNPTGALYSRDLLEQLVQIARENNLIIFSDEIYDRLIIDEAEFTSTASLAPDMLVVTMNGLSKSHVICGFRCGWMVLSGPDGIADEYIAGLFQLAAMRLCSNVPAQVVIPAALADPESTRAMLRPGGRVYEQREATTRALAKIPGLSFVKNKATFYVFPKLDVERFNITNDEQFCIDFLHEKHIMLVNGHGFNWIKPDHFRIVMLPQAEKLTWAMEELGDFLSTYKQK